MKLWSGRLAGSLDPVMEDFNNSLPVDRVLAAADIRGSLAYAGALAQAGIVTRAEAARLRGALRRLLALARAGTLPLLPGDEDIHTAVERHLTARLGRLGAKIHTGRSRNSQVVLDVKLHLKERIPRLLDRLASLVEAVLRRCRDYPDLVMPGYTHLQPAQPVLFSHYLCSLASALKRDAARLEFCLNGGVDEMPLGSGALAGSPLRYDRMSLARCLGFRRCTENSIDAVSDRDFIAETLGALAIVQNHLSRYAEDFIIWSSREYGFLVLDDRFATGSSLMPQKKNPDSLELIRGKAARVQGNLMALLSLTKGLPLAYAKDLQEDKEPLFDSLRTVELSLRVMAGVLSTLRVEKAAVARRLDEYLLATDLADYLVGQGLPFREAHAAVGRLARDSVRRNRPFSRYSLPELRKFSPRFGPDCRAVFNFRRSVGRRSLPGGTAPASVRRQMAAHRRWLAVLRARLRRYLRNTDAAD